MDTTPPTPDLARAALDALIDGAWVLDLSGTPILRNPAAQIMEDCTWYRAGHRGTMAQVATTPSYLAQLLNMGQAFGEYHLFGPNGGDEYTIGLEMAVLRDDAGQPFGFSLHGRNLSREWGREQFLQDRHVELEQAYARLKETQCQLLQSEKMASIGQLAAGVAHEINNPIGYVHSNLSSLNLYAHGLLQLLDVYDQLGQALPPDLMGLLGPVNDLKQRIDYPFVRIDLPQLVDESREGIDRVKKIVLDLRDFSHSGLGGEDDWALVDIHRGLESTLNLVWNELKYKADIHRDFGQLPMITCLPSQLNQVFLNLLINASHALADTEKGGIRIATHQVDEDEICVAISDTGTGIAPEHLARIFDPFFTTKPVGQGTGLGLSLSYAIVQKHGGRLEVESTLGQGSTFRIHLPVQRPTCPTAIPEAA